MLCSRSASSKRPGYPNRVARRRTPADEGLPALAAWHRGEATRLQVRTAVRYTLEELTEKAPGNSVEVRVPPAGVTQAVAGPRHTRGTPPNTVETDPHTWLRLATGVSSWTEELNAGTVHASGVRADLEEFLPLHPVE